MKLHLIQKNVSFWHSKLSERFSTSIMESSGNLQKLLGKVADWYRGAEKKKEIQRPKSIMTSTPSIFFSLTRRAMLSADSSAFGLGQALLQFFDSIWKSVTYTSRRLSSADKRYAKIEKEALAICWACKLTSF